MIEKIALTIIMLGLALGAAAVFAMMASFSLKDRMAWLLLAPALLLVVGFWFFVLGVVLPEIWKEKSR